MGVTATTNRARQLAEQGGGAPRPESGSAKIDASPSAPDGTPSVRHGTVIAGKFRVERALGAGGMGRVFRAIHVDLDRPVALKIVRDELAQCADVVERMVREARTAAKLHSEHVARVLDVGRLETGAPYIVMEYLEGQDLDEYVDARGPLPPEEAVAFLLEACEGIAEAHGLGIIHRDLKPDNLFLTTRTDGRPIIKVLDFGISKSIHADRATSITTKSTVVGSPDYMSPEQMQGHEDVGPETDVWSLGASLYDLLTGHRPFEAENLQGVYARVLGADPPSARAWSPHLPEGLEAVLARCLRKDPRERFATIAELAKALAPYGPPRSDEVAERIARVEMTMRRDTPSEDRSRLRSSMPFATTVGSGTPEPAPKRRTALFAPLAVLLVIGTFTLVRARDVVARSPARGRAVASAVLTADDAASRTEVAPLDLPPVVSIAARSPPPENACEVPRESSSVAPRAGSGPASSARATPAKPRSPERPADARIPASKATLVDPWNPDTFGGRR